MRLKVSSAKRRPFCLGLNVLIRANKVRMIQLYFVGPLCGETSEFDVPGTSTVGLLPDTQIACCVCAANAGNVFPCGGLQRKPLVKDPGMHHGTCVTHVPWCMPGSLARGGGENIPGACAPAILRIWQEAHDISNHRQLFCSAVCSDQIKLCITSTLSEECTRSVVDSPHKGPVMWKAILYHHVSLM